MLELCAELPKMGPTHWPVLTWVFGAGLVAALGVLVCRSEREGEERDALRITRPSAPGAIVPGANLRVAAQSPLLQTWARPS